MRYTRVFFLLTAAHLALTITLLMFVFGAGMGRFDTGGEPSWLEALSGRVLTVWRSRSDAARETERACDFLGCGDTCRS